MSVEKLFLDVRIKSVTRLVNFDAQELESPDILVGKSEYCIQTARTIIFQKVNIYRLSVLNVFGITSDTYIDIKFRDNLRAPVDVQNLGALILQKKCSGSFFIEVVIDELPLPKICEVRDCLNVCSKQKT